MIWNETKGNLFMGFILLSCGIGMIAGAKNFEKSLFLEMGPDLFPMVIGSLIAGLSAILIITNAIKLRTAGLADTAKNADNNSKKFLISADAKKVLVVIALLAGYVAVITFLGFIISSSIYMIASMCLLAEKLTRRKVIIYAVMSIFIAIIVNFIFTRFFWLMLPRGILGI
jgi:hypothetical protein